MKAIWNKTEANSLFIVIEDCATNLIVVRDRVKAEIRTYNENYKKLPWYKQLFSTDDYYTDFRLELTRADLLDLKAIKSKVQLAFNNDATEVHLSDNEISLLNKWNSK